MKVVGVNRVDERPNCAEIRLGLTRYNIEMKRCCGVAQTVRTGCYPIGEGCSLPRVRISSLRDHTSAHLLLVHGAPIKLLPVDALI